MSNTSIQLRKSGVTGNVPANLVYGELALNYADGKLYYRNSSDVITYISGGASDSFSTLNVNSTLVFATSPTDILNFTSSNGVTVSADSGTKTINIDDGITYTLATEAHQLAQEAYDYANTIIGGNSVDDYARNKANGAYDQANTATTLAQSAYDYANTIGGATSSFGVISVANTVSGNVVAPTGNSTLSFVPGPGVYMDTDPVNQAVSISVLGGMQGITIDWGYVSEPITGPYFDFGTIS